MTAPRIVTRRHKPLFLTAAALFAFAVPHAVIAFVYDLPPALVNLHFVTTLLVAGLGWRAEAITRQRKDRKRSRRTAPSPAATSEDPDELAALDLRLRGLDGLL